MRQISLYILLFLISLSNVYSQKWGAYTFYSAQGGTTAYLIDTNNTTYHSWTFGSSAKTGYSSYLLPGGTVLRTVARSGNQISGASICGEVQKVDWNGNVIWDFVYSSSTYVTHHDICPMPNGNVLLIAYDVKTAAEATQAGSSKNIIIWSEKIVEVQPTGTNTGTIVWEWKLWDHLCQNYNSSKDNYVQNIADHPELLNINYLTQQDWIHMNGIDYNAELDQIVFSSHNLNEIYVIDHSTTTTQAAGHTGGNSGKGGDFLYRWGNPQVYGCGSSSNKIFNVVHDAHWIDSDCPNAGYLVGFNNNGVSTSKSSVDMIYPPYNSYNYTHTLGQAYTPSTYTQRHQCNGHTNNMGNSQQLPNGNMLVCIAQSGSIYETNSAGTTIWSKSVGSTVPKAFRYNACYVNGYVPEKPTITQNGDQLLASAYNTYQWFFNGTKIQGATQQTYIPTFAGEYQVQVATTNGCKSDLSDIFYFSIENSINQIEIQKIDIFPNPTTGNISIDIPKNASDFKIKIYDLRGKTILEQYNTNTLDISNFQKGIYIIEIEFDSKVLERQKIVLVK